MLTWLRQRKRPGGHKDEVAVFPPTATVTTTHNMDPESEYSSVVLRSATSIVHLEYDPSTLPSLADVVNEQGGGEWTRFVCISDTHSKSFQVPDGDVLLHSGDLTNTGTVKDFKATMDWLYSLPHKVKIIIAGNHDLTLHTNWYDVEWNGWHKERQNERSIFKLLTGSAARNAGLMYIIDEEIKFRVKEGGREWSVYGSPWSPEFFNWAFNYGSGEAEQLVSKFSNSDILLTHGPPANILDRTNRGDFAGCSTLTSHLAQGRLRPRLHVFGHIHEAHGAHIHTWDSPGLCEAPKVQNDLIGSDIDTLSSDFQMVVDDELPNEEDKRRKDALPDMQRTVFVNAANMPGMKRDGRRVPFGGPGYQPVVVDLKD